MILGSGVEKSSQFQLLQHNFIGWLDSMRSSKKVKIISLYKLTTATQKKYYFIK